MRASKADPKTQSSTSSEDHTHPTTAFYNATSTARAHLQVILKRALALRRADLVLEEEPQPLDGGAVAHELGELGRVGAGLVEGIGEARGGGDVAADAPAAGGVLVLLAQEERVQELGALRVGRILEDGAGLRPGDEAALGGERGVVGSRGLEAEGGGEGGDVGAVGGADERGRGCRATHPTWVIFEQLVEPFGAILLEDEVEGVEDGILVGVSV